VFFGLRWATSAVDLYWTPQSTGGTQAAGRRRCATEAGGRPRSKKNSAGLRIKIQANMDPSTATASPSWRFCSGHYEKGMKMPPMARLGKELCPHRRCPEPFSSSEREKCSKKPGAGDNHRPAQPRHHPDRTPSPKARNLSFYRHPCTSRRNCSAGVPPEKTR